ncbi:MFS transporter [Hamadaea sp.]|uniref:MFS transporter n=1 Tax=Hamadaea sp. TaxID=2024425 RepID=UPI0025C05F1D|nr:MFS transporter [Hamadaea sp.]
MTQLRLGTTAGRATLAAAVIASGMAFLDTTIVNVALPAIGDELSAKLSGLQWTVTGYTLTLAAFVLLGGALGDRHGRRRIFLIGVGWFTLASIGCGFAPTIEVLILARLLQGVGAALLTPGSMAIIQSSFAPEHRSRAIGAWSGLSGVATAVGPFLGGWLIDVLNWRAVFFLNVPLAIAVFWLGRHTPESRNPLVRHTRFDVAGAVLGALGLAGLTYALIATPEVGFSSPQVWAGFAVGISCLISFVAVERRRSRPGVGISDREGRPRIVAMMPVGLFGSRTFSLLNAYTVVVYAAMGGLLFFLAIQLQTVAGYSALEAGLATLPMTLLLLVGSGRSAALAARIGPRLQLVLGGVFGAAGSLMLLAVDQETVYWRDVLPGAIVFGLGMVSHVAPLTASVLSAVDDAHAGVASGINNAAARAASLLAVAGLPMIVGLAGAAYANPEAFDSGYHQAVWWCAGAMAIGAVLAMFLRSPRLGRFRTRRAPA